MRVLVTGGSGFIGSHVVDRLLAAGHEPVVLDLRPSPYHCRREVETAIADVRDPDAVRRAMRGCDAVVHMAAAADVGQVESEPADAEKIRGLSTERIAEVLGTAPYVELVHRDNLALVE